MSFLFDGANDQLEATLTSTYTDPVTLAAYVKFTVHPVANDAFLYFGNSASVVNDSYCIRTNTTDDSWDATSRTTGDSSATVAGINKDGVWTPVVGVFTNNTLRDIYVGAIGNTAQNITSRAVADVLQFVAAGEDFAGGKDFAGRLAELAIWKIALSAAEITSYLAGTVASSIAASDLIFYVPMDTNSLLNLGTDAGGDMTASGNAAFDADHPTIGSPSTTISPNTAGLSV
jgi:hypothetical protein